MLISTISKRIVTNWLKLWQKMLVVGKIELKCFLIKF